MSSKVFTTKKMKLEKKAWIRKSLIGTVVIAVISGLGIGAYTLSKDDAPAPRSYGSAASAQPTKAMLPAFATKSEPVKMLAGKKIAERGAKKVKKHRRTASVKKHKGHRVASHKKHGKHRLAAHKKHKGKHVAKHSKHKKPARELASK